MKLYRHNASALLFDKLDTLGQQRHDSWRCIQFNFSSGHYSSSLRNNFVVRMISELLADTEANIYVCEDGDIFILFQGLYESVAGKLSTYFADMNPRRRADNDDANLVTAYDLSKEWQQLYKISRSKCLHPESMLAKQRTMLPA